MKTATVIRHLAFEDLGILESLLNENGYTIQYIEAGVDSFSPCTNSELLIILGGPIAVYEENNYPFLKEEISIIQHRIKNNKPLLGICLGAQLIAYALGAKVYPGANGKEIGWNTIELTEEGKNSPLRYLENQNVLHWHGDTFDLPTNATLLASTNQYKTQAFSMGNSVLALQFHPEVLHHHFEKWLIGHAFEIAKTSDISVNQLRKQGLQFSATTEVQAKQVFQLWLDQL